MSNMIDCKKCNKLSNIFGSVRFVEPDIKIDCWFCDKCKNELAVLIENSRKQTIQLFIQPKRSKREESIYRCSYCGESWHSE